MNSRQKRKAFYAEHHDAPVQNHWVKTNEFGKIGDCGENKYSKAQKESKIKMRNLKNELIAFGLWHKHTGSSKHSKLKAAIRTYAPTYAAYSKVLAKAAEMSLKDNEMRAELGLDPIPQDSDTTEMVMPESPTE